MGDLTRRGQIEGMGSGIASDSQSPLAEMFGYATDIRSKTQGRHLQWSLATTKKCLATWLKQLLLRAKETLN